MSDLVFDKNLLVSPSTWYERLVSDPSAERLRTSLESYYQEMKHLQTMVKESKQSAIENNTERDFQSIVDLLDKSEKALQRGDVEYAWRAFNTAHCHEILIYDKIRCHAKEPPVQGQACCLQAYACSMFIGRAEGLLVEGQSKLSGWRLARMQRLLCDEHKNFKKDPSVGDVILAQKVLSEHFEDAYLRLSIIREQIYFLEIIAVAALSAWILLLLRDARFAPSSFETISSEPYSLSVLAVIFGILGACVSGILRLEKRSVNKRIPNQLENRAFMLARPLVGAVSAVGVVYFVHAGIVTFGEQTAWLYIATAFAAGFSERLLKFSVEKVGAEEDSEKKE